MTSTIHPSMRLKKLRETMGLTLEEFSSEFNVTTNQLAAWEICSEHIPGPVIKLLDIYEKENQIFVLEKDQLICDLCEALNPQSRIDSEHLIQTGLSKYLQIQEKWKFVIIRKLMDLIQDSKGLTIKAAQLMSYLDIGLPRELRLALGNLQSTLKPLNKKVIDKILTDTYKKSISEVFSYFDYNPRAVTSLAQVHYARRLDGREIAVKIQRPDISQILHSQFRKLSVFDSIGSFIDKDVRNLFIEIKKATLRECDYIQEALNQERVREYVGHFDRTIIPKVHYDLTHTNILVSGFIRGDHFHSFCQKASQEERSAVGNSLLKAVFSLSFKHGIILSDIHPENFLIYEGKVVLLDFGRVYYIPKDRSRLLNKFYQAVILNDKETAKDSANKLEMVKNEAHFDFDALWDFLKSSNKHLMYDTPFKFDSDHVAKITKEYRQFTNKKMLKLNADSFWSFTLSAGTWSLFAELESEVNWHRIALDVFKDALKE